MKKQKTSHNRTSETDRVFSFFILSTSRTLPPIISGDFFVTCVATAADMNSDLDFLALAPRMGSRPLLGHSFGTGDLNGGALSWGSVWSGLKNLGSRLGTWGQKAWNSKTATQLRQHLNDTGLRDKLVEGASTAIHGAVDIARQELDRRLAEKGVGPAVVSPPGPTPESATDSEIGVALGPLKRPLGSDGNPPSYEEATRGGPVQVEPPPSYEEVIAPPPPKRPTTRPHPSMVTEVLSPEEAASLPATLDLKPGALVPTGPASAPPAPSASAPARRPRPQPPRRLPASRSGWQNTLLSVTGAGIPTRRYRRCY